MSRYKESTRNNAVVNVILGSEYVRIFPFSLQISMNVRWIRVLVTRTLIAPTVTALSAVLVKKDLLEMAQFVKVLMNVQRGFSGLSLCTLPIKILDWS